MSKAIHQEQTPALHQDSRRPDPSAVVRMQTVLSARQELLEAAMLYRSESVTPLAEAEVSPLSGKPARWGNFECQSRNEFGLKHSAASNAKR